MFQRTLPLILAVALCVPSPAARAQAPASAAGTPALKNYLVYLVNGATLEIKAATMTPDPSGTLIFKAPGEGSVVAALPIAQVLACGEQSAFKLNPPSK